MMASKLLLAGLLALTACSGTPNDELTGAELAADIGCLACHTETDTDVAPTLHGIWGAEIVLDDGRTVTVDEAYVRRSITDPGTDVVDGFETRMPNFGLSESEVDRLVEYVRSLG